MSEPKPAKTLRNLPREQAFYFFSSIGNYTGESAASLEEFAKKLLGINVKSIEFHLYRGDFEKWITDTLEDSTLAAKVRQLKELKPIGIDLRDRLYLTVSKYCEDLKKPQQQPPQLKAKPASVTFARPQPRGTVETRNKG
ncbi:MAG: DUF5752 family protein [Candidatus Bathyarchaeia archaeon]